MASSNLCHYIVPNVKRLLGRIPECDTLFYQLAFQECPPCKCTCKEMERSTKSGDDQEETTSNKIFTVLSSCPPFISCQSFSQWKSSVKLNQLNRLFHGVTVKNDVLSIFLLPIGPFPEFIYNFKLARGLNLFELLRDFLKIFFTGCKVVLMEEQSLNDFAVTKRKHAFTRTEQCLVTDFFPILRSLLPKDGFCIVGLTWCDLYPCEDLNFVLGQASFENYCCVSSFGRYDPTYIQGFKGNTCGIALEDMKDITKVDCSLLLKLIKVVVHETCHVFGLAHCAMFSCLMNESTSSEEALCQPLLLCPLCMKKVQHACSHWHKKKRLFNVKVHFAAISHFLRIILDADNTDFQRENKEQEDVAVQRLKSTLSWIENTFTKI